MKPLQPPPSPSPAARRASLGALAGLTLAAALLAPAQASDEAQALSDYGCINCHMASQAGFAPSRQRLGERMRRQGDGADARQAMVHEMREHSAINTHLMVSDEAAAAALRQMGRAAK